jgi:hypothetical protein
MSKNTRNGHSLFKTRITRVTVELTYLFTSLIMWKFRHGLVSAWKTSRIAFFFITGHIHYIMNEPRKPQFLKCNVSFYYNFIWNLLPISVHALCVQWILRSVKRNFYHVPVVGIRKHVTRKSNRFPSTILRFQNRFRLQFNRPLDGQHLHN